MSEQRQPPTSKGRDTRQRLLEAARSQFEQHGYAGARTADITEAAGLSPGAFYRYFGDRRELMLVLMQEFTAEVFDFVRVPWDERDPMTSVLRSTELYFEFYEKHRALFGLLHELAQTDPQVKQVWATARQAFYNRIGNSLRRGVRLGLLRPEIDAEVAAELLGGMTEFYAFQRFALDDGVVKRIPVQQAARELAGIWSAGVVQPSV